MDNLFKKHPILRTGSYAYVAKISNSWKKKQQVLQTYNPFSNNLIHVTLKTLLLSELLEVEPKIPRLKS